MRACTCTRAHVGAHVCMCVCACLPAMVTPGLPPPPSMMNVLRPGVRGPVQYTCSLAGAVEADSKKATTKRYNEQPSHGHGQQWLHK